MKYKIIALLLLMLLPVQFGHANDYTIKNVKVDVTADSATDARNQALDKARMNAFNVLKGRIVSASERGALPTATSLVVSTMVDSFEINREKLSKNRYLASVNVTFNERAVQSYLGRHTNMALPDQYYQGEIPINNDAYVPEVPQQPEYGESDLYRQYQQTRQVTSNVTPYKIQVNLNGIRQWVGLQQSLQSIGHVQIHSLNAKRAVVMLSYAGDAGNLQNALGMKGLQLYSNPAGDTPYVLVTRG